MRMIQGRDKNKEVFNLDSMKVKVSNILKYNLENGTYVRSFSVPVYQRSPGHRTQP